MRRARIAALLCLFAAGGAAGGAPAHGLPPYRPSPQPPFPPGSEIGSSTCWWITEQFCDQNGCHTTLTLICEP